MTPETSPLPANAVSILARPGAALPLGLMLLSALTEGVGLLLLVPMLALLSGEAGGRTAQALASLGLPLSPGPLLALFAILVLARALINHARNMAVLRFETGLVDGLRERAWNALLHCDWRLLARLRRSEAESQLISNIDRVGNGVNQLLAGLASAVTLGGVGLAAFAISPRVALGAFIGGGLVLLAYRRMRRRAAQLGEQLGRAYGQVYASLSEGLGALRVIKSFGMEDRAAATGLASFASLRRAQIDYQRDLGFGQIALQGGAAAVLALLVWLAVARWGAGVETVLPLVALFARAMPLLGALQQAMQNWAHARPALAPLAALIAETEAAREPDAPAREPPHLARELMLENVSLRYSERGVPALAGVSLTIPAWGLTALAGPSGSGKSTLADVIGGLIAPDEGRMLIDGSPLGDDARRAWRRRVAYVQQEPVLFTGSIRDNLVWAAPDADEARMRRALADASASFVDALPQGIDTPLGEGGRQLSGGERQRVALARALLRDPDLLILDEATSALDEQNQAAIAEAVARLAERMAVLVIGHGGMLAGLAQRTICLEQGRLVQPVSSE